jgi:TolB protein
LALTLVPVASFAPAARATFPGGNGLIAYSSNADGDSEIYTIPSTGGTPTQLTHNSLDDERPSFSSSGNQIFWDQELASGKHVIMVMKTNGTLQKKLTSPTKDSWGAAPGPNGRVAFVREAGGNSEIFLMDSNGSNVDQITSTGRYADEPAWSPNGKTIAFTREYKLYSAVFVMTAQGRNKHAITPTGADYYDPSFSPDGHRIAVDSDLTTLSDIYTMKSDGSDITQVTSDTGHQILPQYSPNGLSVSYSTDATGPMEIATQLLSGGGPTPVTSDGVTDYNGSWQAT